MVALVVAGVVVHGGGLAVRGGPTVGAGAATGLIVVAGRQGQRRGQGAVGVAVRRWSWGGRACRGGRLRVGAGVVDEAATGWRVADRGWSWPAVVADGVVFRGGPAVGVGGSGGGGGVVVVAVGGGSGVVVVAVGGRLWCSRAWVVAWWCWPSVGGRGVAVR
ncbi:hypothetical protein Tco_0346079, partial [Tanacetum coccineum]